MLNRLRNLKTGGYIRIFLTLLIFCTAKVSAQAEPIRVGFLCQAPKGDAFWELVVDAMKAAADDLNIDLKIKYIPIRDTYTFKRLGMHFLKQKPKLDYLVTKYVRSATAEHLEEARKLGVKLLIINSDVPEDEKATVGKLPREKYANWIGHMVPDDKQAGYDQAKILVNEIKQAGSSLHEKKIRILGLKTVNPDSTVTVSRRAGLDDFIKSNNDSVAGEIKTINCIDSTIDREVSKTLLNYPDFNVLWTSYYELARHAVETLEANGKIPGKDVYIGSFDWDAKTAQAIADGKITTSMTGHFMEGAWALVLLYDYHHGIDFDKDPGIRMNTSLSSINADNIQRYIALTQKGGLNGIDFKKLSKKYNPDLKTYNFNISQFIDQ